jgi:hypothetical protein
MILMRSVSLSHAQCSTAADSRRASQESLTHGTKYPGEKKSLAERELKCASPLGAGAAQSSDSGEVSESGDKTY